MEKLVKPHKPRPDFPLTPHSSGKWVKKIHGRFFYFGRWDDPESAERDYDRVKHDLRAGRPVHVAPPEVITVRELFNAFLERWQERVDADALAPGTYHHYRSNLQAFARAVGPTRAVADLRPGDFARVREAMLNRHLGPDLINRFITNVKTAFRFGQRNGLLGQSVPMGDGFNKVPVSIKRRKMREKSYAIGKKLFTPSQCRKLVNAAPNPFKAMILLGLNCGFLAVDVANLPRAAVDLDGAWLEYPRRKTEVMRAAHLWPETVKALRDALAMRSKARLSVDDGMVFITQHGNRWVTSQIHRNAEGAIEKVTRTDSINPIFAALLESLKIRRKGINFSALRSTFRTAADELEDQNAKLMMMGHAFKGMDEWYVRDVARERLKRVADHVRKALLHAKKVSAAR